MRVAEVLNATSLNPLLPNVPVGAMLIDAVFGPGLLVLEPGGGVSPGLAVSWRTDEGAKTIELDLRDGVLFQDGAPFTARDVVFTARTMLEDPAARARLPGVRDVSAGTRGAGMNGAGRVRVSYDGDPSAALLEIGAIKVLPAHLLEGRPKAEFLAWGTPEALPVGTGPYRVASWTLGTEIVLEAHAGSLLGAPAVQRLAAVSVHGFYTRPGRIADYLTRQDVHVFRFFDASMASELASLLPHYRLIEAPTSKQNLLAIGVRIQGPVLGDEEVRRALHRALDRDGITRELQEHRTNAVYFPIHGFVRPGVWAAWPGAEENVYDPELAGETLRQAGWEDTDGDEVLEKNGRPLRFTLAYPSHARDREQIARRLKIDLASLGVDVVPLALPLDRFAASLSEGAADAVLSFDTFALEYRDLVARFGSARIGPGNPYGYASPETDDLLLGLRGLDGRTPADPDTLERYRQSLFRLQARLLNDLPVIPISGTRHDSWLVHERLHGVIAGGTERPYWEWTVGE